MDISNSITELNSNGFSVIENAYTKNEINSIVETIESYISNNKATNQSKDIFAIRDLINHIPESKSLILNNKLKNILSSFLNDNYFISKSIYFDKPAKSNWFVPYHQDLSISVKAKHQLNGYKNWTRKSEIIGVHPPLKILEDTVTLRIHLDNTNKNNGALRVVPKSHLQGIILKDSPNWNTEDEKKCEVKSGGIMLMKPLLLHASNRTTNNKCRRVLHLEFNCHKLRKPLEWLEFSQIN